MEEWLAETGHGAYTVTGDQAELDLAFEELAPNAVYTVWCAVIHLPPDFKIVDEPCGAVTGSENTFATNPRSKAKFHLHLLALPDSTAEVLKSISNSYHSDGNTYGSLLSL